jgi:hypothetical protein
MKKLIFLPIVFILLISYFACDKHNDPPTLSDISAPDSLMQGDTLLYSISILATDPDGRDDIDSVYFVVTRPDSTSNEIHFAMHDDGQNGDTTADDGRYTLGIQAPGLQNQSGDYIFTFYARDKHGNKSNNPSVIITAY